MNVKWQQWETDGTVCQRMAWSKLTWSLEQTLPSSASQPWTSQLDCSYELSGCSRLHHQQLGSKAEQVGSHSVNLAVWTTVWLCSMGTAWSMRGPKKPQWFSSSPRYVIHVTLKTLIPAYWAVKKYTHSCAAFLLLSWDFFPCKWTDETPELPCCLWWCTTPVCTVVLCYCYSFW